MLQRIQSIWLLFAAGFDAFTFRFPFYSGDWLRDNLPNYTVDLNARTTLWFTILTVLSAVLALVTIFLYRNRKLQLRLTYLGLFLTAVLLTLYCIEVVHFNSGTIALWAIFYFAILVCFILAARGIVKDEKLVRSMDRLR
jgi:phosphatidylserine synthase